MKKKKYIRLYKAGPHSLSEAIGLDNQIAKHIQRARAREWTRGGEYKMTQANTAVTRGNKLYTYDEVAKILRMWEGTIPERQIAEDVGRTPQAISSLIWSYNLFLKGDWKKSMSSSWKRYFAEYTKNKPSMANSNGHAKTSNAPTQAAKAVREEVHQAAEDRTDELVARLDRAWDDMKNALADLVEQREQLAKEEARKAVAQELKELRAFKENAENSNFTGFIKSRLMGQQR